MKKKIRHFTQSLSVKVMVIILLFVLPLNITAFLAI